MEVNDATRSELLRRLAGSAHESSTAVLDAQSIVPQLGLLINPAQVVDGSALAEAHQGWLDNIDALCTSRVVSLNAACVRDLMGMTPLQ